MDPLPSLYLSVGQYGVPFTTSPQCPHAIDWALSLFVSEFLLDWAPVGGLAGCPML